MAYGADPNSDYALYKAVESGSNETVRLLLSEGAHIDSSNGTIFDMPLLHLAAKNRNKEIVASLIEYQADIHEKRSFNGAEPLHHAVQSGSIDIVELLLSKGANLHVKDGIGATVMHWAARGNPPAPHHYYLDNGQTRRIATIRYLLAHGIEPDSVDGNGKQPIDVADSEEIKSILRQAMVE